MIQEWAIYLEKVKQNYLQVYLVGLEMLNYSAVLNIIYNL